MAQQLTTLFWKIETVTLRVLDVNEAPTNLEVDLVPVSEDAAGGTVVGSLSAQDVDVGDIVSFSIVDDQNRPIEHPIFEIDGDEIRIRPNAELDYDTSSQHDIKIVVTDSHGNTSSLPVSIEVSQAEDPPASSSFMSTTDDAAAPLVWNPPSDSAADFVLHNEPESEQQSWVDAADEDQTAPGDLAKTSEADPLNESIELFDQRPDPADAFVPYERSDF